MSEKKNNYATFKAAVLEEFIEIYKSEPCLWQMKNKDYHNRTKKDAAYAKMVAKLREIEPHAGKDTVVKKINNMRSAFRKEKKKVEASRKSGASPDDVYKPTLCYYDALAFLGDQDIPCASNSNLGEEENGSGEDEIWDTPVQLQTVGDIDEFTDNKEQLLSTLEGSVHIDEFIDDKEHLSTLGGPDQQQHPRVQQARPKRKKIDDLTSDVLASVQDHFRKSKQLEDRYDLFAKTVALKLRNLEKRQSLIAEKMINDVLFEAEMGTLTLHAPSRHATQSQ